MGRGERFDWPGLMRLGICGLGLRPAEFWALTPAELVLMTGQRGGASALDRGGLAALLARYPDGARGDGNEHGVRGAGRAGDRPGGEP